MLYFTSQMFEKTEAVSHESWKLGTQSRTVTWVIENQSLGHHLQPPMGRIVGKREGASRAGNQSQVLQQETEALERGQTVFPSWVGKCGMTVILGNEI